MTITHRINVYQDLDFDPLLDFNDNETAIYLPNLYSSYSTRGKDLNSLHLTAIEKILYYNDHHEALLALKKHFQRNNFDTDLTNVDYQDVLLVRERDENEDPDCHWTNKTAFKQWANGEVFIVSPQHKVTYQVTKVNKETKETHSYEKTVWETPDDGFALGGVFADTEQELYETAKYHFGEPYGDPKETELNYVY